MKSLNSLLEQSRILLINMSIERKIGVKKSFLIPTITNFISFLEFQSELNEWPDEEILTNFLDEDDGFN